MKTAKGERVTPRFTCKRCPRVYAAHNLMERIQRHYLCDACLEERAKIEKRERVVNEARRRQRLPELDLVKAYNY